MTLEWIRFAAAAFFMIFGIICFATAALGVWKFGFVMNRVHAAGIGDTLGLLSVVVSQIIASGFSMTSLKLILIVVFVWCTSPVSGHFLGLVEYRTNPDLKKYMRFPQKNADEKTEE